MGWIVFGLVVAVGSIIAWELAVKKIAVKAWTIFNARLF